MFSLIHFTPFVRLLFNFDFGPKGFFFFCKLLKELPKYFVLLWPPLFSNPLIESCKNEKKNKFG